MADMSNPKVDSYLAFGPNGDVWNFEGPNELPGFRAEDEIGRRLSNVFRFQGQVDNWTVAGHSLLALRIHSAFGTTGLMNVDYLPASDRNAYVVQAELAVLLHDCGELVIPDMPAPMKRRLKEAGEGNFLWEQEVRFEHWLLQRLGLPVDLFRTHAEAIRAADVRALAFEKAIFFDTDTTTKGLKPRDWSYLAKQFGVDGPLECAKGTPPPYTHLGTATNGAFNDYWFRSKAKGISGVEAEVKHELVRSRHHQARKFNQTLWRLRAQLDIFNRYPKQVLETERKFALAFVEGFNPLLV
jgi:hypothetical protein